jgi:hypothetical protein
MEWQHFTKTHRNLLVLVGVLLALALIGWFTLRSSPAAPVAETPGTASSTVPLEPDTTSITPGAPPPPEVPYVLSEKATAIDAYAFVEEGAVYFRPVTKSSPLLVLQASPSTFKPITDPTTYPGSEVVADCGAAPTYLFYADWKDTYFYQLWRTPTFRASKVERLMVPPSKFSMITPRTVSDGTSRYTVTYEKAAQGSCKLVLESTLF